MKPLLSIVVTICLVLAATAESEKPKQLAKVPIDKAESSDPQPRKERCSACSSSAKLNLKNPKELFAAIKQLPGEVHTQQTFEGCSTEKGCAGIKVKDGQVIQKFGNLEAFKQAAAQDTANEFGFHAAGSSVFENGGPFWWMNQNSPFKNTGSSYEKFSKSSSSFTSTGGGVDLSSNPFLNGDFSKLSGGFTSGGGGGAGGAGIQSSSSSSSFQSSSFGKGELDISNNPFLNGGAKFGSNQFGGQSGFSAQSGFGAAGSNQGFTGSSPSPFSASTAGSNINLIQNSQNGFGYEQNVDKAFQSTGNVLGSDQGDLTQTCAGQGYVCVPRAQCNNGVVNANGANILQANTQKQYCNLRSEICCRIEVTSSGATGFSGSGLGVDSATFSGSNQGSGLFSTNQGNYASQGSLGSTSGFGASNFGSNANKGFGSSVGTTLSPTTPRFGTSQSNFIDTDSFSTGNEFRPGAVGLKPGIPYLPPLDNTNSPSNIVPSTVYPITTPKPTYLPPVPSTSAPEYLPPTAESSIPRVVIVPPNIDGSLYLDPTIPETLRPPASRPFIPGPALSEIPAGCAAALKCTPIEFCTAEGVISNTTVILTRDQESFRVPLTDCKDLESGRVGKCCRDPFYTDPWPTNQLGKWVPGVFGPNDGKYVPYSTGSSSTNPRPQVTAIPPTTGAVNFPIYSTTPKPVGSTFGPSRTPGFPATTVSPGQYGQNGRGQLGIVGVGQGTQEGFGIGKTQGFGVAVNQGFGQGFNQGGGAVVTQGVGQVQKGSEGFGITQEKGIRVTQGFGQNQAGNQGFGSVYDQGVGQSVSEGVQTLQGVGVEQETGIGVTQGGGVVVNQGSGLGMKQGVDFDVNQGSGYGVRQGSGVSVRHGTGMGVNQVGGYGVRQGGGTGVSQGASLGASQGAEQGFNQGGSRVAQGAGGGTRQGGAGFTGNQGSGFGVRQGGVVGNRQGAGLGIARGSASGVDQGAGFRVTQGNGLGVTQGSGFGVSQGSLGVAQGGGVGFRQGAVSQGGYGGQRTDLGVSQGVGPGGRQGAGFSVAQGGGIGGRQGFGTQGSGIAGSQGFGAQGTGVRVNQGGFAGQRGGFNGQGGGFGAQGGGFGAQGGLGTSQRGIGVQGTGAGGFAGQSADAGGFGAQGGQGFGQGGGFGASQGGGFSASQGGSFGASQRGGIGTSSQGPAFGLNQGFGTGVKYGVGQRLVTGRGQAVIQGEGQGVIEGGVTQGGGYGVENEYSESRHRVFLQRYSGGGQCGLLNPQKPYGNRNDLEVDFAEIPWQAMVLLQTNKSLLCGGVITRPEVVLTSASCVDGLDAKNVLIKGGEWKLGIDDEPLTFQIVQVKTIIRHPEYKKGSLKYDVAILVLTKNLRFAKNIQPICLPSQSDTLDAFYNGAGECIVTGWGKSVLQAHLEGSIMHSLNVSLINPGECQAKISSDYPHLLEQYDQDSCVCGQPTNPLNNICRVDIGSALACTTGDSHFVLRGVYSWDSGCQIGNQIVGFYKFDIEWYEWAIGLIESVRFAKYTKVTVGKINQVSSVKTTQYTTGIKTTGVKEITSGGGSSNFGQFSQVTGSKQVDTGFGQGRTGVSQVSGQTKYTNIKVPVTKTVTTTFTSKGQITDGKGTGSAQGAVEDVAKGFGKFSQISGGTGQYSQVGGGAKEFGQFSQEFKGVGGKTTNQGFGQFSQFGTGKFTEGGLNIGTEIKPITNTFSALYTENKVFQTEPKITYTTFTTKPEVVTFTTKPEYFTYTTKPEVVTYTTKPEYFTFTTKPKLVKYTTKPQYITYQTSDTITSPQVVAPDTSFNPSFSDVVGKHKHNAQCKCLEGRK